jgi:hypothetical protein
MRSSLLDKIRSMWTNLKGKSSDLSLILVNAYKRERERERERETVPK